MENKVTVNTRGKLRLSVLVKDKSGNQYFIPVKSVAEAKKMPGCLQVNETRCFI